MSTLLGALNLSGPGGNELFVYDDCLVRASTGLVAALTGGELDLATLSGHVDASTPDRLVMQHRGNRMVRRQDVRSATLARGRWPSTGLRRLTLQLHSGTVVRYDWAGDNATRAMNHDAYAGDLLTRCLGELLEIRLG